MSAIISKTEVLGLSDDDSTSSTVLTESIKRLKFEQSGEISVFLCGSWDHLTELLDRLFEGRSLPKCVLVENCIDAEYTNLWPYLENRTKTIILLPPEIDPLELDWESVDDRRSFSS